LFPNRRKGKILFLLLICFFCKPQSSPKIEVPVTHFDLTRQLISSSSANFKFDETRDLTYHWKKNSGRYSLLHKQERWKNTQIGFLKNSNVLYNHSLDSILFTPETLMEFSVTKGKGIVRFKYGALGKNYQDVKGTLFVYSDEKIIKTIPVGIQNREKWEEILIEEEFGNKLKFYWESKDSYLFLGTPEFINLNYSPVGYNIILIVIDSLRRDALGCNGQKVSVSPNIDKLCEEGVSFKNHFSNANWTKPSMISMFSGEYSSNLGITNTGFPIYPREKEVYYNQKIKSLPEILRKNGYYTASIMNNVFLMDYTGVGVDLGFHELHQIGKDIVDTEVITNESLEFIKSPPRQPFFLHINYNTPHGSYSPPEHSIFEIKQNSNAKDIASLNPIVLRYFGEVRFTDEQVGKIIEQLKKRNMYDNSMIIITADHGDLFDEKHTFSQNGIYGTRWGHGETHYDEEIGVPFIIKPPRTVINYVSKKIFYSPSSTVSLTPTILGFLGLESQIHPDSKGIDYSKHIIEGTEPINETTVYTEGRLSESIRTSKFKYIRRYPGFTNYLLNGAIPSNDNLEELYDLTKDPLEHLNLKKSNTTLYDIALQERKKFVLRKNSFFLNFPKGSKFDGSFQFQGGIYDYNKTNGVSVQVGNRFNLNFGSGLEGGMLEIMVNEPEFTYEFSIRNDGRLSDYRIGAWGLLQRGDLGKDPGILYSPIEPVGVSSSRIPFLYSNELLSGRSRKSSNPILAEEVKSILKSWGYIHE
jgi:arylsulfatase A-like enzyme